MAEPKPLSEMSDEEVLAELAALRERRAAHRERARAAFNEEKPSGPRKRTAKVETISDDLESLLE